MLMNVALISAAIESMSLDFACGDMNSNPSSRRAREPGAGRYSRASCLGRADGAVPGSTRSSRGAMVPGVTDWGWDETSAAGDDWLCCSPEDIAAPRVE